MQPGQFTLKRVMLSTALIAVGCFGLSLVLPGRYDSSQFVLTRMAYGFCVWGALVWIGSGIGLLFNNWRTGAVIGWSVQVVAFLGYAMWQS